MNRRAFIAQAGGALAWPIAWPALAAGVAHIGFLGAASAARYAAEIEALRFGLRDLGYVEGNNLSIDFRWAEGQYDRLPELARDLVDRKVDVLVTHGTPGALAAERATTTVPIVMAIIGDPVATGVVSNISHPDRNITGSSFFAPELTAKRVEVIKEAVPALRRIGLLTNGANPVMAPILAAVARRATALGAEAQAFPIRSAADLDAAFTAMKSARIDALVIPEDGMLIANIAAVARTTASRSVPAIGFGQFAKAGGLMAYGVNIPQTFRYAATFIDKILKGAKPQELPIEQATRFELIINAKAEKALGLSLPTTLLARADEVIE
ncbi:MAG TPA: ABC transporter substrate-binding protein [Pseudolabrys sp.]|nr:ABC transporter substrate-binding protein [Pseudolabrys sp.]